MRKVTVSITVSDAWNAQEKALKYDMLEAALERAKVDGLNVLAMSASVGNVRAK